MPRNHNTPAGLKNFLGAVRSELRDPKNRNLARPNLTPELTEALDTFIKLQKQRKVVIKPCDKGAGVIILDFDVYITNCNKHLQDKQTQEDGSLKNYYRKVDIHEIRLAKDNIKGILQEAYDNELITKDELEAMDPEDKDPGKFYAMFKVHKSHTVGQAPPLRPIVSGCSSITENLGKFVAHHIKDHGNKHPSYLQDTPDFLRYLEGIRIMGKLPWNAILVSMDVSALYTNTPQDEGLDILEEVLETQNSQIPSAFLRRLMELVLKYNFFEFNNETFLQEIGAAMGSKPIPDYANIFMSKMDKLILDLAGCFGNGTFPIMMLKRFLDDLFMIFCGTLENLHLFHAEINTLHPNIKFTMEHTSPQSQNTTIGPLSCGCETKDSLAFLDTACRIEDGFIETDLYRKSTDRNQYLLPSSCHPTHCTESIPYSLALRIVRICSKIPDRNRRLSELKVMLVEREYKPGMVDAAIARASAIPREKALTKVLKGAEERRPIMVVTYDPRLPAIPALLAKHWRAMVRDDPYLREVFPKPPLTAYRRQKTTRDLIIKAKIPQEPSRRSERTLVGMKKCNRPCPICPWVIETKKMKAKGSIYMHEIKTPINCQTSNLIYCILCLKCGQQYIGETEKTLQERFSQHKGYVTSENLSQATGYHFNQPGHSINHMAVVAITKVHQRGPAYRKELEKDTIRMFNCFHKGINKSC